MFLHSSAKSEKRAVERYLSPNDGIMTTNILPAFSGLLATSMADQTAAPEEIPTISPSSRASLLAIAIASALGQGLISSMSSLPRIDGTKPAPIPWILCGPFGCPEMTADSAGSTQMVLMALFLDLRYWVVPVRVPPVPTPETKKSTLP